MRRLLPRVSLPQFYRFLARYVRHDPANTRAIEPNHRIRIPSEPGVGVFFFPPDSWRKTTAFAVGPLGETSETIHATKVQIARPVAVDPAQPPPPPELLTWGAGSGARITRNLLSGVAEGFAVTLELHGVGYRAEADLERNVVSFRLGFCHPHEVPLVDGDVFLNVISPQVVQVAGINRSKVHQTASKIRALRPPEPYKGKGVRYRSEQVRRKETKKD